MQKLYKTVTKDEINKWYELTFTVPDDIEKMEFEIECPGKVHVMLYGPSDYKGMLDKDKSQFFIATEVASKGFLAGLESGQWKIMLEIVAVEHEMTIQITIKTKTAQKKWYHGDFHTHTDHSDGNHTIAEAISIAKSYGLDFIVLADHNCYSQNDFAFDDFVLMPGLELTTPKGHTNFVGINRPFNKIDYRDKEAVYDMFDQGMKAGCFISVNHPFVGDKWRWGFDMCYHAIEIWNGSPLSRNGEALAWWQEQLSKGYKILGTGGSDVHNHDPNGRCYGQGRTLVFAESLSRKHILEGLHKGNISVATSADSGFVDFRIGNTMIGETCYITNEEQLELNISLDLKRKSLLHVYTDEGKSLSYNLDGHEKSMTILIPLGHTFVRLELWGKGKTNPFFTNPIYIR